MEGRHVHPSTLYPGGVGTVPTHQLLTDYLVRLMTYLDFVKKIVPLNDDVFDFFYEALPGYEEVGRRRVLLGCWDFFQNPDVCDYNYRTMQKWGDAMYVTPGIIVDGELVTTNLVDINLGIRILLGSSYYDDWATQETFVSRDPLGNPVDKRHPWNQTTTPMPQKRDFDGNYSWVMSPRWLDKRNGDHLAIDTGGGAIARLWSTALANLVDVGYVKSTGHSISKSICPKRRSCQRLILSGRCRSSPTLSSETARASISSPTRRPWHSTSWIAPSSTSARERPRSLPTSQYQTRPSVAASMRRYAAFCRTIW